VTELSREARELIAAGKSALVPTQEDRSRVTQILSKRIAAAGLGVLASVKLAQGMMSGKSLTILTSTVGVLGVVGALGTVAYFARQSGRTPVPAPITVAVVPSAQQQRPLQASDATQTSDPQAAAITSSSPPAKTEPAARASKLPGDSLGEEVAILSRAERELHNGRPAAALRALDEHQRRFASGALAQERSAARIQALCALGRMDEANAESVKLKRSSPNSPQAAQARLPCESNR
jgi:hypothetical protein